EFHLKPVMMLSRLRQERLDRVARGPAYIASLNRVMQGLSSYLKTPTWFEEQHGREKVGNIAYFSAEFGIHESLPIYSGGLGILAGDHLKSASDMALPLVGVGLLYRNGYFQQYLSADGWQQEAYPELDFYNLPVEPMRYTDGSEVHIRVD